MIRKLTFVNLMDNWYCDLPEYKDRLTLLDCDTVGGMDLVIEKLSRGEKVVQLEASTEEPEDYMGIMTDNSLDGELGSYLVTLFESDCEQSIIAVYFPLITTIFNMFPDKIYLKYGD